MEPKQTESSYEMQNGLPELYSGMEIPNSPTREILGEKLHRANDIWETDRANGQDTSEADTAANSVADVDGIELIQPGQYGADYDNRCMNFAFGAVNKEAWAEPRKQMPKEFNAETTSFLREHGYQFVQIPAEGDVILYTYAGQKQIDNPNYRIGFTHYGIVDKDNNVVSKLGQGPVVKHPAELVPTNYGKYAYFMRKQIPNTQNNIEPK